MSELTTELAVELAKDISHEIDLSVTHVHAIGSRAVIDVSIERDGRSYDFSIRERLGPNKYPEEHTVKDAIDFLVIIQELGLKDYWDKVGEYEFTGDVGVNQIDGIVNGDGNVRLTIATDVYTAKKIMELIKKEKAETTNG